MANILTSLEQPKLEVGMRVRIRLLKVTSTFPWISLNPNTLKLGKIISETQHSDGVEYTVRFQKGQPCWDYYSKYALEVLPETKK